MRLLIYMMFFFLMASSAQAQNNVTLEQFCRRLPEYKQAPGVEYQPGVNAKGKAVMPADIDTPLNGKIDIIQVPVTIDMAQRADLGLPADTEMDSTVAVLNIYQDGRIDYNGQDISQRTTYLCGLIRNEPD